MKSILLGMKYAFEHRYLELFGLKLNTYLSSFQPLEVVGRYSETQLQVGEKLNKITWRRKGGIKS